ncbi:MAG: S26 family signal peptidase [Pseudomonadota bacterium]
MLTRKVVIFTATITVLVGMASLASETPWVLYPYTPSLPLGLYVRTLDARAVGSIVAFRVPKAAIDYKHSIGEHVEPEFLFMKPVIAGPGDHVCHREQGAVELNGQPIADLVAEDRLGRPLPVWQGCEFLGPDSYFTISDYVPNSFDSRHFGPIRAADILGIYRPLLTLGSHSPPDFDLDYVGEEIRQ